MQKTKIPAATGRKSKMAPKLGIKLTFCNFMGNLVKISILKVEPFSKSIKKQRFKKKFSKFGPFIKKIFTEIGLEPMSQSIFTGLHPPRGAKILIFSKKNNCNSHYFLISWGVSILHFAEKLTENSQMGTFW